MLLVSVGCHWRITSASARDSALGSCLQEIARRKRDPNRRKDIFFIIEALVFRYIIRSHSFGIPDTVVDMETGKLRAS
jgi:hypothetical protein